ncbi:MAG: nucleotide sugar dehydrogenase [Bacillota bacterium]
MKEKIISKINAKTAKICVIGLGYVGLPLAVGFCKAGFSVSAIDISEEKVKRINEGRSPVLDVTDDELTEALLGRKLEASNDFEDIRNSDVIIICVPTPLRKTKEPDISYIVSAVLEIQKRLVRGQIVILESTTYPGTTDEVVLPMLEETGLQVDKDFFLAFSPERVDPGNKKFNTANIPKVVGGVTEASTEVAAAVYSKIVEKVYPVSSSRVAETAKLLENTFRAVNIGMVNELALLCHTMGIDVWEVINAAATKPFGFMPFYPGPGIGGHCIPLDPHYLAWKARLNGFEPRFIDLADQINSYMPKYVVERVQDILNEHGKPLKGSNVLIFGVAYKKDIDDVRESPAINVIELLVLKGANVSFIDPYVNSIRIKNLKIKSQEIKSCLDSTDIGVVITDHTCFNWVEILSSSIPVLLDTRGNVKAVDSKVIKM